jgi:hypothetical protein
MNLTLSHYYGGVNLPYFLGIIIFAWTRVLSQIPELRAMKYEWKHIFSFKFCELFCLLWLYKCSVFGTLTLRLGAITAVLTIVSMFSQNIYINVFYTAFIALNSDPVLQLCVLLAFPSVFHKNLITAAICLLIYPVIHIIIHV